MLESDFKTCPVCRDTCQANNDDEEYADNCDRCDGTGYIEVIKRKPETAKKE